MATNIGDGSSLPSSNSNTQQPNNIQQTTVQTVTSVASGDVKKALISSASERVAQPRSHSEPPPTTEDPAVKGSALYNFYYNQQLMNNQAKTTSLANYVNGSNNELTTLTNKIKDYEKRGTQLTKDELTKLKKDITAIKSNKYVYSSKEVLEFSKTVKSFNKAGLSKEKISGSLKTLKELKSGFATRTAMDKASKFKNAPATVGNVLKSGLDDVKDEIKYKGNGEKEALLLAGSLSIVSMGAGWREKSRDLVAKNFDKDTATEDSFNTGIKKALSKNKKYKASYIDNGYLLTGFKELRNSADAVIKKTFEKNGKPLKNKKLKVDFNSRKSTQKYLKLLNETAAELGLGKNLSGATTEFLEKLRSSKDVTDDQKIIIDAILEIKNIDYLKDTAIVEHMKELGIETGLVKIDYNNKNDIKHALNCYSNFFCKTGVTDYTKMSTRKLKKMLKDESLDPTTKTMIQDILALKKQQHYQANKKMAAKTSAIKAYAVVSKLIGSSDFMQGAQMAIQVISGVKMALVAANVLRKVLGKSSKFVGKKTYKLASHFAKKTEKGAKVVKKIDNATTKYKQIKADTKRIKTEFKSATKEAKNVAKDAAKGKLKNTKVGKNVTKVKQSKVLNNNVTKKARKLATDISKKITDVFSKLLSAFNFLNKLKLYILVGIGVVALLFYLLYAMLLPLSNNSEIAAPVEMQVQTDADGKAQTDANGNYIITETDNIKDTVFYKIYDMLVTADNNWFIELENIKTKDPHDVVFDAKNGDENAKAYFPDKTITGFWNPNKDKFFVVNKFGTQDEDETGNRINEGVYHSFNDNDGNTISKHSNIKMCISLAHGFINGDHANYPDEFKEFAMGLWNNSHSSHPVLMEQNLDPHNKYIYSCIGGDETFTYKCTTDTSIKPTYTSSQEVKDQADAYNATLKVITSDTKNSDYANAVKQSLIVTENGCTSKTHKNNGSTGYILYDNVLHKETKNITSDGSALNSSELHTSSTPEFTVYNKDSLLTEPTKIIKLSSTQTLYYSSSCKNHSIVEDGTYITKFCNQSYMGNKAIGEHATIKGCISKGGPSYCGTRKTTLEGNQAYVRNTACTNSTHHSFKHGKITITETKTKTEVVSWIPFVTQQVEYQVQKDILDPACDASFFGAECMIHYWYECQGHVDAYCNGHNIPNYKIQCNGHNECAGHTANICSGHVDLDVASTIVGLDENDNLYVKKMWDKDEVDDGIFNLYSPNYHSFKDLCDSVFGPKDGLNDKLYVNNPKTQIKDASGNITEGYVWDPDLNGGTLHWTEDMKGYTNALYNTDWFELYGFDEIYATHEIDTTLIRLSDGEIKDLIEKYYPCNAELYFSDSSEGAAYKASYDKRALILTRALTAVERIPYYPGGTTDELKVSLEENNFGEIIRDASGKPIKKHTPDGKVALYLKGLDSESFARWASTTATDVVNTVINKSTPVSLANATPGDIVHYAGTSNYGIYVGSETINVGGVTNTIYYIVEMVSYNDKAGNVKLQQFDPMDVIIYKTIS